MTHFFTCPTPIFNTPDLHSVFSYPMPVDEIELLRELEMIAFAGQELQLTQDFGDSKQIKIPSYPVPFPVFINHRFPLSPLPVKRKPVPTAASIIERLKHWIGYPYIWGGNYCAGIKKLEEYFPPKESLSREELALWTFQGCDCSGILYEASEGHTPRNASWLIKYGDEVKKDDTLQPLDIVVWHDHLFIILDEGRTIESKHEWGGVIIKDLDWRMRFLKNERGDDFVIRRWHPEMRSKT